MSATDALCCNSVSASAFRYTTSGAHLVRGPAQPPLAVGSKTVRPRADSITLTSIPYYATFLFNVHDEAAHSSDLQG